MDKWTKKDLEKIRRHKLRALGGPVASGSISPDDSRLTELTSGEKMIVAFYAIEFINTALSKEQDYLNNLISDELNDKLDGSYQFEYNLENQKSLTILNKLKHTLEAESLLQKPADLYFEGVKQAKDELKENHLDDFNYVLAYRNDLLVLINKSQKTANELNEVLRKQFHWSDEEMREVREGAESNVVSHMKEYLGNIERALGGI